MAAEAKTLVIGSVGHQFVTSVDWSGVDDLNVVDYHYIVVDVGALEIDQIFAADHTMLRRLKGRLSRFVASGGSLVVIGAPARSPAANSNYDNWEWCPVHVVAVPESGDTVAVDGRNFGKLLSRLKHWTFHYEVNYADAELAAAYGIDAKHLSLTTSVHAANRYKGILACRLSINVRGTNMAPSRNLPGSVFLLPKVQGLDAHFAVQLVLEDLLDRDQVTTSFPDWLQAMRMAAVEPIDARIEEIQNKISELTAEMSHRTAEKFALERYKGLLYLSSFELERLVADCLEKLGGTIKPAKYSQEEFILEYGGGVYLAECKGVGKSISLTNVRQLTDYILQYEEDEGSPGKGILFGNAWRELPPNERDTNDRPIFPGNVRRRATQLDIALISTVDLFVAFSAYLEGRVTGVAVLEWIIGTSGVSDLSALGIAGL